MSHRIEYQWGVFHVPAAVFGLSADRFVVAIEGGDNNVFQPRTGKRARSWEASMIGTADQVLRQAVYFAGGCEGGGLQPGGRWCKPEAYIRRIRRLIEAGDALQSGCWSAVLRVWPEHPAVTELRQIGLEPSVEAYCGKQRAIVNFRPEQYPQFFGLVDKYGDELPAWYFAKVFGLPES